VPHAGRARRVDHAPLQPHEVDARRHQVDVVDAAHGRRERVGGVEVADGELGLSPEGPRPVGVADEEPRAAAGGDELAGDFAAGSAGGAEDEDHESAPPAISPAARASAAALRRSAWDARAAAGFAWRGPSRRATGQAGRPTRSRSPATAVVGVGLGALSMTGLLGDG
jgi:hypothetical protein